MGNRAAILVIAAVVAVLGYGMFAGLTVVITDEPSTTPAIDEVVATNTTMYRDNAGRPTVVGEILNGRSYSVKATVTVTFYRNGEVLRQVRASPILEPVPRGERGPFVVRLPNETAADSYDVNITYNRHRTDPNQNLRAVSIEVSDSAKNQVSLAGTIRNTGDRRIENVLVVTTFYSSTGDVIGVRSKPPSPAALPAGATANFRIRFRTLGQIPSLAQEFDHYRIIVVANKTT
jgi:hypothetical protein